MLKLKIVKIIDEHKVVVNGGSSSGVNEDDTFEVFEPGEEVFDPDSGLLLGTLDFIKAKLRVVDILPKMCICTNRDGEYQTSLVDALSLNAFNPITKRKPLNVEAKDISGGYEGHTKKIKIGDLVRKIN